MTRTPIRALTLSTVALALTVAATGANAFFCNRGPANSYGSGLPMGYGPAPYGPMNYGALRPVYGPIGATLPGQYAAPALAAPTPAAWNPMANPVAPNPTLPPIDAGKVGSKQQAAAGTEGASVNIRGMQFQPSVITIKAGERVTWSQNAPMPHTVTSTDGTTINSGRLSAGQTFTHTFDAPGTYEYYCELHPGMKGSVVVN
ncbi:MAG: cupredoxin family copper-binding protein [Chromatiales bacterium]|nr:cupredoxin family copper-binding protein [Gammaproteobacteria bacterium]MCP5351700.1 cupredoxin family copper-binding protein [Chromatiales bacterium]